MAIVNDRSVGIADPEFADRFTELLGCRQHVREWVAVITQLVEIDKDSARNVIGFEVGARIPRQTQFRDTCAARCHRATRAIDNAHRQDRRDSRRANPWSRAHHD